MCVLLKLDIHVYEIFTMMSTIFLKLLKEPCIKYIKL